MPTSFDPARRAGYRPVVTSPASTLDFEPALLDDACRQLGLAMVVLYGSRATGEPPPHRDSDLDVAVRSAGRKRPDFWTCYRALAEVFDGESLDLVLLERADPLFRWEIMRAGRLLWGDPVEHLEFRAYAYRDFVDSWDLRELERSLFRKKMEYIGRRLDAPA